MPSSLGVDPLGTTDRTSPPSAGATGGGPRPAQERRRLFHRFPLNAAATANPFPRPRDEHGDTRSRKYTYDGTIPDKGSLLTLHGRSLELVSRHRPMRAAMLRDSIERVDAAIERHGAVVAEEQDVLQGFNEDAANAKAVVQEQIDGLRLARAEREAQENQECDRHRAELAEARTEYAALRTLTGQPLPLLDFARTTVPDEAGDWEDSGGVGDAVGKAVGALAGGAARSAEANSAAIASVASAAPSVLREGGNLLTRFFGAGRSAPQPQVAATGTAVAGLAREAPFAMEEARKRSRPAEVHAHESGYPARSAAARIARGNPVANFIALVTCGAIFGSSIGLLLGFIDPEAMAVAASRQLGIWAVCTFFGIALFYILGCTAEAIFALISEQYHAALVATHRKEPAAAGKWLKKAAVFTAVAGGIVFVLLIGIEAVVERYGIVQLAISRMSDAVMLGRAAAPKADLQGLAAVMIALIASVPFMCFHAARGWTHARLDVLQEAMESVHAQEAWSLATQKYEEGRGHVLSGDRVLPDMKSTDPMPPLADGLRFAPGNGTAGAVYGGDRDAPSRLPQGFRQEPATSELLGTSTAVLAEPSEDAHSPAPVPLAQYELSPARVGTPPAVALTGGDLELRVSLARANERLREAFIRLREGYRGRRDALHPFDSQIEQLQAMIVPERVEMPLESKRRIEDAYADVLGAVQAFDRMFQEELKTVERLMRGGVLVRFRDWLFQRAA